MHIDTIAKVDLSFPSCFSSLFSFSLASEAEPILKKAFFSNHKSKCYCVVEVDLLARNQCSIRREWD